MGGRNYGEAPDQLRRSQDVCIQRKCVENEAHPFRFLNTHDRLFPTDVPMWNPVRAATLRSHDVREKEHCHITGIDNTLTYNVSLGNDQNKPKATVWMDQPPRRQPQG